MERLSELEGVVVGILWLRGPQTAYAIRQVFARSASPQWASSAGTIYPLVQRLEKRRLIRSEAHSTGRRRARKYALTAVGQRALRAWIGPPLPLSALSLPIDAMRTRIWYLGALSERERTALIKEGRRGIKEHLRLLNRQYSPKRGQPDPFYALAWRGIVLMTKMRLAWLAEVESALARMHRKQRR
jgi:DNA-binding PadR family transcriptional regulator